MNYIKIYADFLGKNICPAKKIKVIFDCSNGTTGLIIQKFKIKNLKFKIINGIPDGNFPAHGPNPLKNKALNDLRTAVKKYKADIGVIFDADGDRAFFIDNKGRPIDQDVIARLLIWRLKPKKIIIDAVTGWQVKNLVSNLKIIESRVGRYFIKKLIRKINADFGAERSGHYYFSAQGAASGRASGGKKFYFDSGILAAIEVINAASELPYSLADYVDLLPKYHRSKELNFKIENPQKILKKIEKKYKNQATKIYRIDGLTMKFQDWWFNLRPSNTEPLIRLNIEAADKNSLNKIIKGLSFLIKKYKAEK